MKKISLITAVMLYDAIKKLYDTQLDYSSAHALVMTKNELEPHVMFFAENEKAMIEKYANKDEEGNLISEEDGRFTVSPENAKKFNEERVKLNSVEVEVQERKLKGLPEKISMSTLELLLTAFELPEEGGE